MIRACLFDLDGVVVDTAKYHFLAWRNLAGELGFEFTEADNERLKGVSRMDSLEILLEVGGMGGSFTDAEKLAMADTKNSRYLEYIMRMTPGEVLPGVERFLRELRDNGIGIALGSVSRNAMTILDRVGIRGLFDAVVDGTVVSKAKPDPEVFLRGAAMLGVKEPDCVVFEDAVAGIEAARRAGMRSIGVGSPATLCRADAVIAGFDGFSIASMRELLQEKA